MRVVPRQPPRMPAADPAAAAVVPGDIEQGAGAFGAISDAPAHAAYAALSQAVKRSIFQLSTNCAHMQDARMPRDRLCVGARARAAPDGAHVGAPCATRARA